MPRGEAFHHLQIKTRTSQTGVRKVGLWKIVRNPRLSVDQHSNRHRRSSNRSVKCAVSYQRATHSYMSYRQATHSYMIYRRAKHIASCSRAGSQSKSSPALKASKEPIWKDRAPSALSAVHTPPSVHVLRTPHRKEPSCVCTLQ
jgi:hypothetical protein